MSFEYAIQVSHLSKCYQIYEKPSDRLKQMLFRGRRKYYQEFWALQNVNFNINKGETLGIIGRNGSGKSTLLQMICGTLNPTLGEIKIKGRVAALLELGAGFNPEFTGEENVYMAASLYGLTTAEIKERFIKISNFADIGAHMYQPVKTYSSGMYVRLAFAVIAHVDPDILVIDEALAVGDAIFTQKCMRFIRKFKENGTLIFVSHDPSSVLNLCNKVLWIDKGEQVKVGDSEQVVNSYQQFCSENVYKEDSIEVLDSTHSEDVAKDDSLLNKVATSNIENSTAWGVGKAKIISVELIESTGLSKVLQGGEDVILSVKAKVFKNLESPIIGFYVKDRLGQNLFGDNTYTYVETSKLSFDGGVTCVAKFKFKLPLLPNGFYAVTVAIAEGDPYQNMQSHWVDDALIFEVSSQKLRYGLVGIPFEEVSLTQN